MKFSTLSLAVLLSTVGLSSLVHADSVESEMRMCAMEALSSINARATVFEVDNSQLESTYVDRNAHKNRGITTTLELSLAKKSGEQIGDVVCTLDDQGNLLTASFKHQYYELASN